MKFIGPTLAVRSDERYRNTPEQRNQQDVQQRKARPAGGDHFFHAEWSTRRVREHQEYEVEESGLFDLRLCSGQEPLPPAEMNVRNLRIVPEIGKVGCSLGIRDDYRRSVSTGQEAWQAVR